MLKVLLFSLTYMTVILLSYYLGDILWSEGISYTFPLFTAVLGGAIFNALVFDGYIFKGILNV